MNRLISRALGTVHNWLADRQSAPGKTLVRPLNAWDKARAMCFSESFQPDSGEVWNTIMRQYGAFPSRSRTNHTDGYLPFRRMPPVKGLSTKPATDGVAEGDSIFHYPEVWLDAGYSAPELNDELSSYVTGRTSTLSRN